MTYYSLIVDHSLIHSRIVVEVRDYIDGHYMAYKLITLPYILFMFIEIKYTHYHSSVMFVLKSMSICDD